MRNKVPPICDQPSMNAEGGIYDLGQTPSGEITRQWKFLFHECKNFDFILKRSTGTFRLSH